MSSELDEPSTSENSSSKNKPIFSRKNELFLLNPLKDKKLICSCNKCLLEEVPILAYETCNFNIKYPEAWDKHKRPSYNWSNQFYKFNKEQLSNLSRKI